MAAVKIGVIKEGKVPPDKRVPLTPNQCKSIIDTYGDEVDLTVQKSDVRKFTDFDYERQGLDVVDQMHDRDVLLGVKEVPLEMLIPQKTYFFFSHTIKEQPYNRDLLKTILERKITLIDWECLTDVNGKRLIGFGRYAGVVGAYNGFRTYGLRYGLYSLKPAHECADRAEMEQELEKIQLPNIKIVLTGRGRVAHGAMEVIDKIGIRKVDPTDYLNRDFSEPVYAQVGVEHYNRRKDGGERSRKDFFKNYRDYESDFMRFARSTDFFIAGHFYAEGSPYLFTREDAKDKDFRIRVVADISCDIDGPVASTIRPSTIVDPIYGYNIETEEEDDYRASNAIAVMAVDNLPCELPLDASQDFGEELMKHILPLIIRGDKDDILERATIAKDGDLTEKYRYLQDYVDGK
ncbi:NAD(P)-dependent oxidoreductase [Salibacter sp.]|uniref:NAD(P)-dependent oxidoreductase n=1 Tax=Salibacter sp. TaxID=2010995 RepID=UPI002870B39A|nr:NAD(P)-dependent oxidoreductase [Salibacter sp.]MDR9487221.1 NAD(P)-dependent oxidoreductase [Salibacter sp.]